MHKYQIRVDGFTVREFTSKREMNYYEREKVAHEYDKEMFITGAKCVYRGLIIQD